MRSRLATVATLGATASIVLSTPAMAASLTPTRPVDSPVVSNGWILNDAELQWNTEYELEAGDELLSTRFINQGVFEDVTLRTGQFGSLIGLGAASTKQLQPGAEIDATNETSIVFRGHLSRLAFAIDSTNGSGTLTPTLPENGDRLVEFGYEPVTALFRSPELDENIFSRQPDQILKFGQTYTVEPTDVIVTNVVYWQGTFDGVVFTVNRSVVDASFNPERTAILDPFTEIEINGRKELFTTTDFPPESFTVVANNRQNPVGVPEPTSALALLTAVGLAAARRLAGNISTFPN